MAEWVANNPALTAALVLWVLPWKGFALWKAARKNHRWWFLGILIINSMGLVDILYIFYFSEHAPAITKKKVETEAGRKEE